MADDISLHKPLTGSNCYARQDMNALADTLETRFDDAAPAWGVDIANAHRHLEGWEFLLACELQRRQLDNRQ